MLALTYYFIFIYCDKIVLKNGPQEEYSLASSEVDGTRYLLFVKEEFVDNKVFVEEFELDRNNSDLTQKNSFFCKKDDQEAITLCQDNSLKKLPQLVKYESGYKIKIDHQCLTRAKPIQGSKGYSLILKDCDPNDKDQIFALYIIEEGSDSSTTDPESKPKEQSKETPLKEKNSPLKDAEPATPKNSDEKYDEKKQKVSNTIEELNQLITDAENVSKDLNENYTGDLKNCDKFSEKTNEEIKKMKNKILKKSLNLIEPS